ncbi:MAG: hypothetical protein LM586_03370 [Desulfurococcales archaeon]|nr:hypothetical protein [Desulfurococcales archaeon]MCC6061350.1 hypothetical protein [Desulfurococcales archaeon]
MIRLKGMTINDDLRAGEEVSSVSPWNMPELRLPYGYPMALIMIFISMWLPYLILRKIKFL